MLKEQSLHQQNFTEPENNSRLDAGFYRCRFISPLKKYGTHNQFWEVTICYPYTNIYISSFHGTSVFSTMVVLQKSVNRNCSRCWLLFVCNRRCCCRNPLKNPLGRSCRISRQSRVDVINTSWAILPMTIQITVILTTIWMVKHHLFPRGRHCFQ